ncbi:MAG: hypothetical protein RLN72_04845, partial [Henriciella sp.]
QVLALEYRSHVGISLRLCQDFEVQDGPEGLLVCRGNRGDKFDQLIAQIFCRQVFERCNTVFLSLHFQFNDSLDDILHAAEKMVEVANTDAAIRRDGGDCGALEALVGKLLFRAFQDLANPRFPFGGHFGHVRFSQLLFSSIHLHFR